MTNECAISVVGLRKSYGDLVAVDGIDFRLEKGTCLGLLGPNGAGKTTTIEILEGLNTPDEGELSILGRRWASDDRDIRLRIGVQLQETRFPDKLTVRETIESFCAFYPVARSSAEIMAIVGLEKKADSRVVQLSGGQHQRLALACALVNEPELLFLDEPSTGLDPQARRRVWEVIENFKAQGGSVLLTTHYMDEAERLADDLVVMDEGQIIATGTPSELIARLGGVSIVEVAVDEADEKLAKRLSAIEGVNDVGRVASDFVLEVSSIGDTLPLIIQSFEDAGEKFRDLRSRRPTLEDVFVSLTGKRLRDA